ncbi:MAG TPA: 4Fe-4S binding protein [Methanoregula sp.]|nr:4Fe-4S binding protein [Methanoregula sp.]
MQFVKSARRIVAATLLTAGLAYPACAAVCPKGHGACPSPGRCFLFVDADGNSLCDYTARTGSQATPSAPSGTQQAVSTVTPAPDTTVTAAQNMSSGGFLDTVHLSAPVTGILLFLVFAGILFTLFKTGIPGVRIRDTIPALALSSLFGLGLSLVATSVLAGDLVNGTVYALIYMAAGTLLAAYLWHTGVMTRKTVLLAAGLGTLAGFAFQAPIMPAELGGIVNIAAGTSAFSIGVVVICAVIVLALLTGRTFCGTICPVGSLQEICSEVPVKKIVVKQTRILELVRLAVFIATVIAALGFVDIFEYSGLYDLFSLMLSATLIVASVLVLLSVFVYRPVCRILCPFGLLFSLFAAFSRFWLRRSDACIDCGKCEKACPVSAAGRSDSKRECYLCGRCTEACPVPKAISYCSHPGESQAREPHTKKISSPGQRSR